MVKWIKVYAEKRAMVCILSDDSAGRVFKAILEYACGKDYSKRLISEQEEDAFEELKAGIDESIKACINQSIGGKNGAAKRWHNAPANNDEVEWL